MTHPTVAHSAEDTAIVANETFILATRDTGYRDVAAAVAELIDNSLQANARHVRVFVRDETSPDGRSITLGVLDDGHGMSAQTLQTALQFGGSHRFGDRSGLGRFGMGLPNSSVSQTRRFDVYSWQLPNVVLNSYLDVDEVARGSLRSVPPPVERSLPDWASNYATTSGTLVVWTRCDRLGRHRANTIAQRLFASLGRIYRYPLWAGVHISINGTPLVAIDPLFLQHESRTPGATAFGAPLRYEFAGSSGDSALIEVRFSELPVREWHDWTVEDKRRRGIVGGAGVSIVRAGREIDYGWYLMGSKRRENYDDWWRCEVSFSPELDELFGVTHSKQGITPTSELRTILGPDLEAVARTLNSRVRAAFEDAKATLPSAASRVASARDQFLPPPASSRRKFHGAGLTYRIDVAPLATPDFYRVALVRGTVVVTLNSEHPFYAHVYEPIRHDQGSRERYHIECMLLAAVRADLEVTDKQQREILAEVRRSWADSLAAYLDSH